MKKIGSLVIIDMPTNDFLNKVPASTLDARDFSSAVSGFFAAHGFGQQREFPPHARKTSGTHLG